jgi:hypothetical protein
VYDEALAVPVVKGGHSRVIFHAMGLLKTIQTAMFERANYSLEFHGARLPIAKMSHPHLEKEKRFMFPGVTSKTAKKSL